MARIELRDVTKVYDRGITGVVGVTLAVADGEVLAIVGPSGSGKTTALRLIAGLEEPTRGEIFFGDRLVNAVPAHRRDVAMVFQGYPLYPHMTVAQNLGFGLKMLKTPGPRIEALVLEAARGLEIQDLLDRRPATLSGGQRQRVALGKALVRRPAVLLLDEPFSSMDAQLRDRLRKYLMDLLEQTRTTCVYVTHDPAEADAMADRICVLRQGRVDERG